MKLPGIVLAAMMIALPSLNAGVVIDFESAPAAFVPGPPFVLSTQGWTVSSSATFAVVNTPSAFVPNHGGNVLVDAGGGSDPIQLTNAGGATFTLVSLVAGPGLKNLPFSYNPLNADVLNVTGTFFGGGTISTSFDLGSGYSTFDLPSGWDNLTGVQFYGSGAPLGGNAIALDDILVNPSASSITQVPPSEVPEPSSLILLAGTSLVCVGLIRRRRRAAKA